MFAPEARAFPLTSLAEDARPPGKLYIYMQFHLGGTFREKANDFLEKVHAIFQKTNAFFR